MPGSVKIDAFSGMNNVKLTGGKLPEPRVILNADVDGQGVLRKRDGYALVTSLSGAHSLWASENIMLVAAGGILYRALNGAAVSLGAFNPSNSRLYYAEINGTVYVSNRFCQQAIDLNTLVARPWGLSLPASPTLTRVAGNLPEGVYRACFTVTDAGGRMSGNGGITAIEVQEGSSIVIANLPTGGVVWVTDPNGSDFFYAGRAALIDDLPSPEPLPSLWCQPPNYLEQIVPAFGRMWGAFGNYLYYSMPFSYEWFRLEADFFYFEEPPLMVAPVKQGIYVGFASDTVFLNGTDPAKMDPVKVGEGVNVDTMAYGDGLPELGNAVPMWTAKNGIVAGSHSGQTVELTSKKIRFDLSTKGAAMFRKHNGEIQYLSSFPQGSAAAFGDQVTCEVIRNGRVFLGDYQNDQFDAVRVSDSVTAELNP